MRPARKRQSFEKRLERENERREDAAALRRIEAHKEKYQAQFKGSIERTYREYIKSRHWEARKDAYFETNARECSLCGSGARVELNHIYYGNFGFERDEDLIALCRRHHEELHAEIGVSKDMRYATAIFIERYRDASNR